MMHDHTSTMERYERRWANFRRFNEQGGKFRVAVVNRCNLDCFFCHNEAMANPRGATDSGVPAGRRLSDEELLEIINTYTAMGGWQVNLTGGEPLAHPDLAGFIGRIDKHGSRLALNTNAVLARRLLARPRIEAIDDILASLHTTNEATFRDKLGGRSVGKVIDNIVALSRHGYRVELNYSLGPYNRDAFADVLDFALEHGIAVKAIALVRPTVADGFYGGEWVDPTWLSKLLAGVGAQEVETRNTLGGSTTTWDIDGVTVKVKNIARGRLSTDFCRGCQLADTCGEGIYGVRVGVDGIWKPCLLRKERFCAVEATDYRGQILDIIDAMIGRWSNARFVTGAPT